MEKMILKLQTMVDSRYNDLHTKFEHLATNIKYLDKEVARVVSTSERPSGSLSSKAESSPKEHCNVILPSKGEEELARKKLKYREEWEQNERVLEELTRILESPSDEKIFKKYEALEVVEKKEPKVDKGKESLEKEASISVPPGVYEPKIPFPMRFHT